jgi:hypothetical protein
MLFWAACVFAEMALEHFGPLPIWRQHRRNALQRAGEDLMEAAEQAGLIADHGEAKVISTIANGFRRIEP